MESLKRLVAVLWAPTDTFRKIADRPTWAAALIVLLLIGAAASWVAVQKIDVDAQRRMVRDTIEERTGLRGDELESRVDQQMDISRKVAPFTPVFAVVFAIGAYAVTALVFFVAFRLAGGELGFVGSFATTLHGLVPQGVAGLIALPLLLSQGTIDPERLQSGSLLASNLSFLAPEDAPRTLVTLLSSLDLFSLWALILLVIGYSLVARVSKGAATVVVVGAWVVWVAVKVGFVALFT